MVPVKSKTEKFASVPFLVSVF